MANVDRSTTQPAPNFIPQLRGADLDRYCREHPTSEFRCTQCRRGMNPAERMLSPVCGRCVRVNQQGDRSRDGGLGQ